MHVFLSGPMGSGKSTVAPLLAQALGVACVDLDAAVEQQTGVSVAEIFRREGERRFREIEASTLEALLAAAPRAVLALGGGTVTSTALRRSLLARGTLVTLDAPPQVLAARVGPAQSRPLLAGRDAAAELELLRLAREDAYAECHARVDTTDLVPEAVTRAVLDVVRDAPIVVPLGRRTYRIEVGSGIRTRLCGKLPAAGALVLVTDEAVGKAWANEVRRAAGREIEPVVEVALAPGERHKTFESVLRIWNAALDGGVDRSAFVLGLGGGVVGDLAGFAASTLLRGIRVGHLPTTLLAMVDSAIGGKTGFDTRHGKNLIGTFHQPEFVLSDLDLLSTLPLAERRAGLAEVVKSAWIDGEASVSAIERDAEALVAGEPGATERAVRMAAALKARVVAADEREGGLRAVLNLGHTLGHGLEAAGGYEELRHGEAVALGMVAAVRVAQALGIGDARGEARMTSLLHRLGLPVDLDVRLTPRVFEHVKLDKKRQGGQVTFVLPAAPGAIERVPLSFDRLQALVAPGRAR